jgi:hypothetical protein
VFFQELSFFLGKCLCFFNGHFLEFFIKNKKRQKLAKKLDLYHPFFFIIFCGIRGTKSIGIRPCHLVD